MKEGKSPPRSQERTSVALKSHVYAQWDNVGEYTNYHIKKVPASQDRSRDIESTTLAGPGISTKKALRLDEEKEPAQKGLKRVKEYQKRISRTFGITDARL